MENRISDPPVRLSGGCTLVPGVGCLPALVGREAERLAAAALQCEGISLSDSLLLARPFGFSSTLTPFLQPGCGCPGLGAQETDLTEFPGQPGLEAGVALRAEGLSPPAGGRGQCQGRESGQLSDCSQPCRARQRGSWSAWVIRFPLKIVH